MTELFTAADAYHDSRSVSCRAPFGALKTGETVTIRLYLSERFRDAACILCTNHDGRDGAVLMDRAQTHDGRAYRQARLSFDTSGLAGYYFTVNDGRRLLYLGAGDACSLGILSPNAAKMYSITVYEKDYSTPRWFKNAVAYHIFVDRFARGSGGGGLARASFHTDKGRTIVKHESWTEPLLYTPVAGQATYDPCDFYGGDLQGITEKLPYLAELGVTCLYLSPLFESPSNHKYNTGDYEVIDPMYGDTEAFKALCETAKGHGIRVMLDGVFSHTGDDSRYFNKFDRYDTLGAYDSPDSPYYRWYDFYRYPTDYRAWWGFPSLPEVDELEESYVRFTATGDDAILKRWIRRGAYGWRLDVADELPEEFIRILRRELKKENADAVLLGEVWEDASNKFSMGERRRYVMGDELDSVMNYPLRRAVLDFFTGSGGSEKCAYTLETLRENYPAPFFYSCLNLLSSHDVPRALTLLGGGPDKDSGLSRAEQAAFKLDPESRAVGIKKLKLATALVMCYPGVPCVYYGDEAGVAGCMDPFNRAVYPWGGEDEGLIAEFSKWIALRNAIPALRTGETAIVAPHRDVLALLRFIRNGRDALGEPATDGFYLFVANRAEGTRRLRIDANAALNAGGHGATSASEAKTVAFCGEATEVMSFRNGTIRLSVPPLSAVLFEFIPRVDTAG